jgi:hypothetical protein
VKVCINESSNWKRDLYYCDNETEGEENAVSSESQKDLLEKGPISLHNQWIL